MKQWENNSIVHSTTQRPITDEIITMLNHGMRESKSMRESQKVLSLRGRATDLMYTKLPGILKAAKTFPKLASHD